MLKAVKQTVFNSQRLVHSIVYCLPYKMAVKCVHRIHTPHIHGPHRRPSASPSHRGASGGSRGRPGLCERGGMRAEWEHFMIQVADPPLEGGGGAKKEACVGRSRAPDSGSKVTFQFSVVCSQYSSRVPLPCLDRMCCKVPNPP